ncbi:MAG: type II toxin-antitoxin system PemK/MazF family toxin [Candidatus Wildermuthbacteria bacterium]|nr:type II toxin-antitoxin system PemK/MazF family toxin [Candidatus Wildermuthbacteria bacterium]
MTYSKDFDAWNEEKKKLQVTEPELFFHEREVWWCRLGVNIGFEEDGKNSQFARPVVIIKTYSINAALVVPLTTTEKTGIYYFDVGKVDGRVAKAVLSQVRFVDKRRMINKVDVISKSVFEKLRSAIIAINLT